MITARVTAPWTRVGTWRVLASGRRRGPAAPGGEQPTAPDSPSRRNAIVQARAEALVLRLSAETTRLSERSRQAEQQCADSIEYIRTLLACVAEHAGSGLSLPEPPPSLRTGLRVPAARAAGSGDSRSPASRTAGGASPAAGPGRP